jgi:hypothetical protein
MELGKVQGWGGARNGDVKANGGFERCGLLCFYARQHLGVDKLASGIGC